MAMIRAASARPSALHQSCNRSHVAVKVLRAPGRALLAPRRATAADDGSGPSSSGSSGASGGAGAGPPAEPSATDLRAALERAYSGGARGALTGAELTQLIRSKWGGRSYEARIARRGERVYLHVMWKFLEQASFPLTPDEYARQMDAVAGLVSEWGAADLVRDAIARDRSRGPGYTGGGSAKAVSIPIPVATRGAARAAEWRY